MATEEDRSQTFDSLVSGLNSDERHALLSKMQSGATVENVALETRENFADEDTTIDFKTRIKQESIFVRFFLWLKSIFSNLSEEEVYNNSLVAQIARNVERQSPGIVDYHHKYLSNDFYEKLVELKHTADFFTPVIAAYEKDPGSFYVLLGSLLMPQVGEDMDKEADPYLYSLAKEANSEMRTSLLRKMDDILQKIPSDKRADIQAAYADLKKLLTQKYGLPKPEVVLHIPVNMPGVRTTVMDTYVTEWSLDNGSELPFTIALNKNPTWGTVEVYYANKALREKLKTQSRQDI